MHTFATRKYRAILGFGIPLATVLLSTSVQAQVTLVSQRTLLGATDFVDWGALGGEGTTVASPFNINSNGGVGLTLSEVGTTFIRANEGGTWGGNFALGDHLLYTGVASGPITVVFGTPVSAAGYQIEPANGGPFVARFRAFDNADTDLGSVTEIGSSHSGSDNSAIFIGGKRQTNDIKKIVISLDSAGGDIGRFSINRLDFATAAATPEPSSVTLLVGLTVAGGVFLRRRKK